MDEVFPLDEETRVLLELIGAPRKKVSEFLRPSLPFVQLY